MFKLNSKVIKSEQELDDSSVLKYIEELERKNLLIRIENIFVDAKSLVKFFFVCNPELCVTKKKDKSCCGLPDIFVSNIEKDNLKKLFPRIKKQLNIKGDIESILEKNKFNQYVLKKKNGHCILSFFDNNDNLRCIIHKICLEKGLNMEEYKPYMCSRWPLEFIKFNRNKYLLTACLPEVEDKIEAMPEGCSNFPCALNKSINSKGKLPLYIYMRETIEFLFGKDFWQRLDKEARKILLLKNN